MAFHGQDTPSHSDRQTIEAIDELSRWRLTAVCEDFPAAAAFPRVEIARWRHSGAGRRSGLMTRPVKTLGRNDPLSAADALMSAERIRHLPVLDDNGRVVGIVSHRDLFFNALVRALGFDPPRGLVRSSRSW